MRNIARWKADEATYEVEEYLKLNFLLFWYLLNYIAIFFCHNEQSSMQQNYLLTYQILHFSYFNLVTLIKMLQAKCLKNKIYIFTVLDILKFKTLVLTGLNV